MMVFCCTANLYCFDAGVRKPGYLIVYLFAIALCNPLAVIAKAAKSWVCSPWSITIIAKINSGWLLGDCYKSELEKLQRGSQVRGNRERKGGWTEKRMREKDVLCVCTNKSWPEIKLTSGLVFMRARLHAFGRHQYIAKIKGGGN